MILNATSVGDKAGRTCTANPEASGGASSTRGFHLQGGPHFDCRKIEEAMLTFTKLFVLPGLSPPYVMFHITEILAWIYLRRICLKIRNNL
jgi:hypothetical protein